MLYCTTDTSNVQERVLQSTKLMQLQGFDDFNKLLWGAHGSLHSAKTLYYDHRHFYAGQTLLAYKVSTESMFSYQMQWNAARFFNQETSGP